MSSEQNVNNQIIFGQQSIGADSIGGGSMENIDDIINEFD